MHWSDIRLVSLTANGDEISQSVQELSELITSTQQCGVELVGLACDLNDQAPLDIAARAPGQVHLSITPMTETVKLIESGRICGTIDRDTLWQVRFPIVAPALVVLTVLREIRSVSELLPALSAGRWPISALGRGRPER